MKLATKIIIIIAVLYNAGMGYAIALTAQPYIVLSFFSVDIFLIFYYMWLLIRQNLGVIKFEKEHKDILNKARDEVKGTRMKLE
ncbi:MAG: hypothetical protein KGH64_05015 [Candidatus Micrarchaeota archaeon]|nr:hypothetical protein [Candidatus Micrarchaeota archaeon]MDE1834673.1 hypothetical protein [Candidatus Micrarchaeota archaeon]MDE1859575.1 hypothetical protein [Candidatus Micrarchaeota archaeon]